MDTAKRIMTLQMKWNFLSEYRDGKTTKEENEIAKSMGWL